MKKLISYLVIIAMLAVWLVGCTNQTTQTTGGTIADVEETTTAGDVIPAENTSEPAQKYSIGFVNLGPGAALQAYVDEYEKLFNADGWDASYVDGNFDPTLQISQIENYIAQGVDVLIAFPLSGEAASAAVDKALAAGIKVISFVNETENYDVYMSADNAVTAAYVCELAAKWVDENFPDAADGSINACVLYYSANQTNVEQSDPLLQIEEYSSKIKLVKVAELPDETVETGVSFAENIYTTNPEINLFLTAQTNVALGVSNYYTSLNSPIKDYSNLGIFTINGSNEIYQAIQDSAENKTPLRGTIVAGGPVAAAQAFLEIAEGLMAGKYETPLVNYGKLEVVDVNTAAEIMANGTVNSYSTSDLDALFPSITYTTATPARYPLLVLDN